VSDAPFFLVGSERSGTTLLRLMLSHHPRIACAPEFEFLVEFMDDSDAWPDVDAFAGWLSTNRIFLPHELAVDRSLSYPELCRSFLDQFGAREGRPVVGGTCHKHFERLLRLWPDVRYVHLVRDGRDVTRSCIGMGWAFDVWHGAERWIAAERTWDALAERLPEGQRLDVVYEELLADPERELGRICAFLGLEYDPAMLSYVDDSTYEAPNPALAFQWKRKLGAGDLALLEARIGDLLRARGYEPSGVEPARVGPLRRFTLGLRNRLGHTRWHLGRYGLKLVVLGRVARHLGLEGLERRVTLAKNEIANRHIQ
jgi:hypothetical protein